MVFCFVTFWNSEVEMNAVFWIILFLPFYKVKVGTLLSWGEVGKRNDIFLLGS